MDFKAIHRNEATNEVEQKGKVNEIIAKDQIPISKLARKIHLKRKQTTYCIQ